MKFLVLRKLKRLRSDSPLAVRGHLATLGNRLGAVHPAYIFAGTGPGILPSQEWREWEKWKWKLTHLSCKKVGKNDRV